MGVLERLRAGDERTRERLGYTGPVTPISWWGFAGWLAVFFTLGALGERWWVFAVADTAWGLAGIDRYLRGKPWPLPRMATIVDRWMAADRRFRHTLTAQHAEPVSKRAVAGWLLVFVALSTVADRGWPYSTLRSMWGTAGAYRYLFGKRWWRWRTRDKGADTQS